MRCTVVFTLIFLLLLPSALSRELIFDQWVILPFETERFGQDMRFELIESGNDCVLKIKLGFFDSEKVPLQSCTTIDNYDICFESCSLVESTAHIFVSKLDKSVEPIINEPRLEPVVDPEPVYEPTRSSSDTDLFKILTFSAIFLILLFIMIKTIKYLIKPKKKDKIKWNF